ncbi:MAG TPA: hypothetical protein VFV05_25415 [Methylomirabilota bacterium]|nr:hypothetical protein [Methylomirabilota bacterium]
MVDVKPTAAVAGPTPLGGVGGGVLGAAKGVGLGVLSGAGCFVTIGRLPELCVVAIMTPYWVGRGTIEGAMKAMPEGERRASQAAIIAAIRDVDHQRIASAIEEEGRRRSASVTILSPSSVPADAIDTGSYRGAAVQGIDTVAEITLGRLGLERRPSSSSDRALKLSVPDVDPMLGVAVEARLRLVKAADDTVVLEKTYAHRSPRDARFVEWAHDGAAGFREARDTALETLAREIAEELFGAARPAASPVSAIVDEPVTEGGRCDPTRSPYPCD